jgi:hypothetical protein
MPRNPRILPSNAEGMPCFVMAAFHRVICEARSDPATVQTGLLHGICNEKKRQSELHPAETMCRTSSHSVLQSLNLTFLELFFFFSFNFPHPCISGLLPPTCLFYAALSPNSIH